MFSIIYNKLYKYNNYKYIHKITIKLYNVPSAQEIRATRTVQTVAMLLNM